MKNKHGGGARTNESGLKFEQDISLEDALIAAGYTVSPDGKVKRGSKEIALSAPKHKFYERILNPLNISWEERISKKLLPDEALLIHKAKTLFIIEKKYQNQNGSVDEKLQTCAFKLKQYKRLLGSSYQVEYLYVCSDWFNNPKYEDVHNYIKSVGCHIFFNEIPLDFFGLSSL